MQEYPKIQTVYLRDPATDYTKLLEGQFAKPEFAYLQHNTWVFTEKVDGTNMRVRWDGHDVTFVGKTDNASISRVLQEKLAEMFYPEKFTTTSMPPLCLYGEGYGAKIQKGGGNYIPNGVSFILFDIMVHGVWLERSNVEDIATKLMINIVPIVGAGTLQEGVNMVRDGYSSKLRKTPPEGIVMRPQVELLNRRGERIITKIKMEDFK